MTVLLKWRTVFGGLKSFLCDLIRAVVSMSCRRTVHNDCCNANGCDTTVALESATKNIQQQRLVREITVDATTDLCYAKTKNNIVNGSKTWTIGRPVLPPLWPYNHLPGWEAVDRLTELVWRSIQFLCWTDKTILRFYAPKSRKLRVNLQCSLA